jgi:hypothetical protein
MSSTRKRFSRNCVRQSNTTEGVPAQRTVYLRYALSYRDLEEMMNNAAYQAITRRSTAGRNDMRRN